MKFNIKKICCATIASFMIFSSVTAVNCAEIENNSEALADESQEKTTIYIVGDSTACIYANDDDYAVPRAGWGMYFGKYLNSNAEVVDLALAGRSSKSFTSEDNYQTLCDNLKKGDYLIIQFGHNDAKKSSEEDLQSRYTDPEGATETEGSFKYSLYNNYVKIAQDKGATPILITPVSRRKFKDGEVTDSHGKYDDAVRELAEELDIELIDATKLTENDYNEQQGDARLYHAMYNDLTKGEKGYDNTHYSHYGALVISGIIADEIKNSDSELSEYVMLSEYVKSDVSDISDDLFKLTRGEAASLFARLIGYVDEAGESNFSDVKKENENYKGIYNAKQAGIVLGDENALFNPDKEATLLDVLLMASRALQDSMDIDKTKADISIFDSYKGDIKDYAKADLAVLIENGIIDISDLLMSNDKATKRDLELYACRIYDLKAEKVNEDKEAQEQSLDELEKVENTK